MNQFQALPHITYENLRWCVSSLKLSLFTVKRGITMYLFHYRKSKNNQIRKYLEITF